MVRAGRNFSWSGMGRPSGMGKQLSGRETDRRRTIQCDDRNKRIRNDKVQRRHRRSRRLSNKKRMGALT